VPGVIDYIYAVPPASSGRQRATKHALSNVAALLLFAIAWSLRDAGAAASAGVFVVELAGAGLLVYAGLLGGTLVTRNLVSVDHRYANAGRWSEAAFTAKPGERIEVADVEDLKVDQMKLLRVNGRRIVLAKNADGHVAFEDRCSHRGGSLAGGVLIDGTVQCLWHGSQFDTATGKVACGPAGKRIDVFDVQEQRGKVWLVVPR
jgi:nitrite reductase/ring-hydroxylating ferredoxin subunit